MASGSSSSPPATWPPPIWSPRGAVRHERPAPCRVRRHPALIGLGWVSDMPRVLDAVDVVVQNSGGMTSLEARIAGCSDDQLPVHRRPRRDERIGAGGGWARALGARSRELRRSLLSALNGASSAPRAAVAGHRRRGRTFPGVLTDRMIGRWCPVDGRHRGGRGSALVAATCCRRSGASRRCGEGSCRGWRVSATATT